MEMPSCKPEDVCALDRGSRVTVNGCPLRARSVARYIVDVLPSVDTGYGVVWTFGLVAPPEVGRRRNLEERARMLFFSCLLGCFWLGVPLPHYCVFLCFARRSGSPSSVLCVSEQAHGGTVSGLFIARRLKVANKHPTTSEVTGKLT